MVGSGGHKLRQLRGEAFRLLARYGVDDGGAANASGEQRADGLGALRDGKLDDFNGEVIAAKAVDEARGVDHAELRSNVGLHRGRGGGGEGENRNLV